MAYHTEGDIAHWSIMLTLLEEDVGFLSSNKSDPTEAMMFQFIGRSSIPDQPYPCGRNYGAGSSKIFVSQG